MSAAFYCVADRSYFLGAVGLINSLRLVGHREPVVLLDCGLTDAQRALLEPEVELIAAPDSAPPTLLKTIAPLQRPAASMLLIDTDMIVVDRLDPFLAGAGAGRVVAFRNDTERFVEAWSEVLDLPPVRRQPYVSFGLVALPDELGADILRLIEDRQDRIDFERTYWRERRHTDYPLLYADQDVLNAILAGEVPAEALEALDQRLAPLPPFRGLRVTDRRRLTCAYDTGGRPLVIHHWLTKPWLEPTHDGVYSQLLRRLLLGDDVAIRLAAADVPPWLRVGVRGFAARQRINVRERLRYRREAAR